MNGTLSQPDIDIQDILNPNGDNASRLLHELDLSGLPSRERVHAEIEKKLLTPTATLPQHWLPSYQM